MAYDEKLAERIRSALKGRVGVTEKQMFGGIAFLLDGKMFVGIVKGDLMVRVGKQRNAEALKKPHARQMDFTGKPMEGYVFVAPAGCKTPAALEQWCNWGTDFVVTVPVKPKRPPAKSSKKPPTPRRPPPRRKR